MPTPTYDAPSRASTPVLALWQLPTAALAAAVWIVLIGTGMDDLTSSASVGLALVLAATPVIWLAFEHDKRGPALSCVGVLALVFLPYAVPRCPRRRWRSRTCSWRCRSGSGSPSPPASCRVPWTAAGSGSSATPSGPPWS